MFLFISGDSTSLPNNAIGMGEDNDTENTLTGEIALTADNYTTIKLEYKNNPEIASMMLDKEKFLLIAAEYLNVKEYMFW